MTMMMLLFSLLFYPRKLPLNCGKNWNNKRVNGFFVVVVIVIVVVIIVVVVTVVVDPTHLPFKFD